MRKLALVLAAAVPLALAACGDDSTGPENVAGTYALQTVEGNTLPWRFFVVGDEWIELTAGSLVISGNGTWTAELHFRERVGGETTEYPEESVGTWERDGDQIIFTDDSDGSVIVATLSGNRLTAVDEDDFVYVFTRL